MQTQILSCHQLSKFFFQTTNQLQIFDKIDYQFLSNKSYALMGPSGIGKSTLIAMMAGIDHPTAGLIKFNDQIISQQIFEQRMQLFEKKISIVFQQPCLIAELTVLENVMLKSIIQETVSDDLKKHALQLLNDIGLEGKALAFPHNLSGGQQQRVSILRSIFDAPQFLLADEPTGNLDQISAALIIKMLLEYQKKYVMGLIISTHDILVAKQCDVILKIENQKLIEC
ncbi:ABC transporter ATP-binding protein [Candidatus Babeliales bacterium]|nr:ABC transporter ATP-binding protein [Candidatus Babeliales bacterium]